MDRCEIDKLFALLSVFYPNSERGKSKVVKEAWALALSSYRYDDVKAAAAIYAARNKYYPDLYDITGHLSPITPDDTPTPEVCARKRCYALYARLLAEDCDNNVSISAYAREHGLSWSDARDEMIDKGLC